METKVRDLHDVVKEIQQEIINWQDWADRYRGEGDTIEERDHRRGIACEEMVRLTFALLWVIEGDKPCPDFLRASVTGRAHGMTYGLIAHERTMDDGTILKTWSIHT